MIHDSFSLLFSMTLFYQFLNLFILFNFLRFVLFVLFSIGWTFVLVNKLGQHSFSNCMFIVLLIGYFPIFISELLFSIWFIRFLRYSWTGDLH